nr:ATP-binding protein [Sporosalibacterium faouarense]
MFIIVGVITGFLVESDFNKKKLLELQIKRVTNLENYTRNILDSITNVVIATDNDFNIQSINQEGSKLFGVSVNNINKKLSSIFIEYQRIEELITNVMENKTYPESIETSCRTSNDKVIDVKLLIYPLRNIVNKTEGIVIVLEDITELRKLENQVRRAEKLSAVGELASGVAHEIRNPMGIIKTISQTIHKEMKDQEMKEGIEIIIHEIDRANKVIKELLDFAKPSIQQVKLYSIDKLIKEILLITTKFAQQYHVDIKYTSIEDVKILLDSEKLKQGFINIVFNAIQAMPDGGHVNINFRVKEKWAEIIFKDNGTGIPQDKLEKVFEPFYTTKKQGTGLGLAITHRIIEEHKGYMEIESQLGKGTKIIINLPIR